MICELTESGHMLTVFFYTLIFVIQLIRWEKVKKVYLHMRPEYKNKSCDIYFKILGYTDWKKIGTTTTKRAYAIDIYKNYVYK